VNGCIWVTGVSGCSDFTKGEMEMRGCSAWLPAVVVFAALVGLGWDAPEASAQAVVGGPYSSSYRVSDYLGAPGLYGMSYGFASYGMPQTYSVYSAYPGPSYGSNYPPYGVLPGRYGVGLWRPGFVAPGYVYGAASFPYDSYASGSYSYRTFGVGAGAGYSANRTASPPPVGVYAPALGPRTLYGW
jgi:hypothetical protein